MTSPVHLPMYVAHLEGEIRRLRTELETRTAERDRLGEALTDMREEFEMAEAAEAETRSRESQALEELADLRDELERVNLALYDATKHP